MEHFMTIGRHVKNSELFLSDTRYTLYSLFICCEVTFLINNYDLFVAILQVLALSQRLP